MTDKGVAFREEVEDRITDLLLTLSYVTMGDLSSRLDASLSEESPFSALFRGVNETIDSLARARAASAEYQREMEEKLATIETQRAAIRELSTPVIELWKGVLCLPVVGSLDQQRSEEMTESLLSAVVEHSTECVIIDVTGIDTMDTQAVDYLMRAARSVALLGARCCLTGIRPTIAKTIVALGVDVTGLETFRSLRDALGAHVLSTKTGAQAADV